MESMPARPALVSTYLSLKKCARIDFQAGWAGGTKEGCGGELAPFIWIWSFCESSSLSSGEQIFNLLPGSVLLFVGIA